MGINSWVAVGLFLIFIAPGLLFDLLAEKRLVRASESALRETGRIALASLIFSGTSAALVIGAGSSHHGLLPDWTMLVSDPSYYFAHHYARLLWTLTVEVVVALGLAYAMHWNLARGLETPLKAISPWSQVFKKDRPPGLDTQVCVELTNGDRIVGKLAWFSPSLELEGRELVLAPPLYVQRPGQQAQTSNALWERVVVAQDQIVRIDVGYVPWSGPAP